jgi:hypothetical protein
MNHFVLGWRAPGGIELDPAARALSRVTERLGFLAPGRIARWTASDARAALAWVAHDPGQVGGVRYVAAEPDRLALFAGRPVHWPAAGGPDGSGPLDPGFYLRPFREFRDELDGRWAAARYDTTQGELELATDALGAYPVFVAEHGGARWFSNDPTVLALLTGADELDPLALAGLLGGGWSLAGDPLWRAVRRLPRGGALRLRAGGGEERARLLPDEEVVALLGAGCDAAAAAADLVAGVRALAGWPGRPDVVPVTGGRDSRLVLAAALGAGLAFTAVTGGAPEDPDVVVARELCRLAGVDHALLAPDPHGDMHSRPERAAEVVDLLSAGTACLSDAAGFPLGPRPGAQPPGAPRHGGGVARGYYGQGRGPGPHELTDQLYAAFVGRRPGRAEIVNATGARLLRAHLSAWVAAQLDAAADPRDVPDLFYLLKRMAMWAGPSHGCVEPVRDTTSPLWSRRLLGQELGLATAERGRETFALRMLERLEPALVDVPFADRRPWPGRQGAMRARARRARVLAAKALAEAARRTRPARRVARDDPFARVHPVVRERVLSAADHPAWALLDRPRVEGLLTAPPAALDTMSRYYVWRLGQVFLVDAYARAGLDPEGSAGAASTARVRHS